MNDKDYLVASARTDTKNYNAVLDRLTHAGSRGNALSDEESLQVLHATMGINTESGEIMDVVKRYLIYGKPIDRTNVIEEVGDMFWYLALLARALGFTFEDAKARNIAKLKARYPEKFTEAEALNRNLEQERKVLES